MNEVRPGGEMSDVNLLRGYPQLPSFLTCSQKQKTVWLEGAGSLGPAPEVTAKLSPTYIQENLL